MSTTCTPGTCVANTLLAVSKTATPSTLDASDWYFYALDQTIERTTQGTNVVAKWGDFHFMSVVGNTLAMSMSMVDFVFSGPEVATMTIRLLDKSLLINGSPITNWTDFVDLNDVTLPVIAFGDPGGIFLIAGHACSYQISKITNPLSSPVMTTRTVTSCTPVPPVELAAQPGGAPPIWIPGPKQQYVYRSGSLWTALPMTRDWGSGLVSAIYLAQIDVTGWPDNTRVVQSGTFGVDGVYHFVPAIMVDAANNVTIVYERSSPNEFVSAYYTWCLATDPAGMLRSGSVLKAGSAPWTFLDGTRNRFVDYLGSALDPRDGSVWMLGMYAKSTSSSGTWVGNLVLPGASPTLTVSRGGGGNGRVASSPGGIDCGATCSARFAAASRVTLTATPDAGSVFGGWSGDADCADGIVMIDASKTCTATFVTTLGIGPTRGSTDFNGDGGGDIFRYNPTTGSRAFELGNRAGAFGSVSGAAWTPGWALYPGDFNGDGFMDLLLLNPTTGDWVKATNTGRNDFTYFASHWDPGWTPYVMDLNGDKAADLFLYNAQTGRWFKCLSVGAGDFSYIGGAWSGGWSLYPADWNGDGKADLLLYSPTTGQWFRATTDGGADFTYYTEAWSGGWSIFPGDFDGDGKSDLLLYSSTTGQWFLCVNTGVGFTYAPGQWAGGWTVQVADFDANGRADVFLYDATTGRWFECVVNSTATEFSYFTDLWSPGWQTFVTDLDGDRRSDLILYNATTAQWFQCLTRTLGSFTYGSGTWEPGLTIVASTTRVP